MALAIRRGDLVEVIAGDDRSRGGSRTTGRVLAVFPKERRVLVEGVNRAYKHVRPSRRNPRGGRLSKELPIDISNVLLFCAACGRGVRVGFRYLSDGAKERYCKRCGRGLGIVSPAKAKRARA
jgi:large subunit ribosomal protein L24